MSSYIQAAQQLYTANANPETAKAMAQYMRNLFPFLGIRAPQAKLLTKEFIQQNGLPSMADLPTVVKQFWDLPEREYHHLALALLSKHIKKAPPEMIELLEYLVVNKSWWDTIDGTAVNFVGTHFKRYPELMAPHAIKWIESDNFWLQRTAILFQLKYKNTIDLTLLSQLICRRMDSKEFFVRKAIGWVLREYSKTDANWVIGFIEKHEKDLSGLSKREGLKWLGKQGVI